MADPGRILDSLSTSVLIVDRTRSILYLNVAAETLFGIEPQPGARPAARRSCSPTRAASTPSSIARSKPCARSCGESSRCDPSTAKAS